MVAVWETLATVEKVLTPSNRKRTLSHISGLL